MVARRLRANRESLGNCRIGQSLRDQLEHFALAVSKLRECLVFADWRRLKILDHPARYGWTKDCLSLAHCPDRTNCLVACRPLKQIPASACPHRREDRGIILEHRNNEHATLG